MAVANLWNGLKDKVRTAYNNFFYDGSAAPPPPSMQDEGYSAQQPTIGQWQESAYGAYNAYQQPGYQQNPAQPYYQPGTQQTYHQDASQQYYGQNGYQAPSAAQQHVQQTAAQPQPQSRFRRSARAGKIVDFNDYQQKNPPADAPQPEQPAPQEQNQLLSARIINARSMGDCRSAITLLRNGDAVLVVMENITDPAEMRRLVDTLSGACYSLTASITKVSRHGSYLLAPQTMAVFADQATIAMNSASSRTQTRPAYQSSQRPFYTSQQREQQQPGQEPVHYQPNAYQNPQGFTQRAATPEEAPRDFYQRPMPQQAQPTGFSAQPTAYGYAPDESPAAAQ